LLLGGALVLALVVALVQPGWLGRLTAHWPYTDNWPEFCLDLLFFLAGYVIYASVRLGAAVRQHCFAALSLGLAYWVMVVVLTAKGKVPAPDFSPSALLFALTQTSSAWLLTLALLGLAMRYLTSSTKRQRYLTSATFPVYLLHMPLLTVVAYFLLKLPAPWYLQLLLIASVTIVGSFAIYELVIRRTSVTRFLFGAKAAHAQEPAVREPPNLQSRLPVHSQV
jgi:membrane-bound acyltransferase YfiQ involved in biofilm formation